MTILHPETFLEGCQVSTLFYHSRSIPTVQALSSPLIAISFQFIPLRQYLIASNHISISARFRLFHHWAIHRILRCWPPLHTDVTKILGQARLSVTFRASNSKLKSQLFKKNSYPNSRGPPTSSPQSMRQLS